MGIQVERSHCRAGPECYRMSQKPWTGSFRFTVEQRGRVSRSAQMKAKSSDCGWSGIVKKVSLRSRTVIWATISGMEERCKDLGQ